MGIYLRRTQINSTCIVVLILPYRIFTLSLHCETFIKLTYKKGGQETDRENRNAKGLQQDYYILQVLFFII